MTQPVFPQPPNTVMVGTQGAPGPVSASVSALSQLAAMPQVTFPAGAIVAYTPAAGGPSTYYQWAPSSPAAADGVAVIAGLGGNWVQLAVGALSSSVPLSHGGTTTLSAAQAACPTIALTDSGLTGAATVVLPVTSVPIERTVDLTGVTFGGQTVTLEVGTAAKTLTVSSGQILRVRSDGVGKLYALTYS